jgi:glucose-1-phosphate adenylyltransferase
MTTTPRILALVLAGGQDSDAKLHPLTINHVKPSVVFGGFRLVDFVLSNLVNSGIESIYVLAEHGADSLIEHVQANWALTDEQYGRFISVVLPRLGQRDCHLGTADAVWQNIDLIERHAPDIVAVFASDQVYRMDVRQMVAHHLSNGADVTVASTEVPIDRAPSFGIMVKGCDDEIWDFQEKPDNPAPVPFDPTHAYASMGNYLFNPDVLIEALKDAARKKHTDFGRHVLPELILSHKVCAYDFSTNLVPGVEPYEKPGYWHDIGSLEAYIEAVQDITGRHPRFRLHNPDWPMLPLGGRRARGEPAFRRLPASDAIQIETRVVFH